MTNRLDHIINAPDNLEREATLAKVGLSYRSCDEDGELILPVGTSAQVSRQFRNNLKKDGKDRHGPD